MKKLLLAIIVSMAVVSLPAFANAVDGEVDTGSVDKVVNPDAEHDRDWIVTDSLGYINLTWDGEVYEYEEPAGDIFRYQDKEFTPGVVVSIVEGFDWGQTQTGFRAEISTTSDITTDDGILNLYQGHVIRIASELVVDEDDVGKSAQCLVVAGYSNQAGGAEPDIFILSDDGWEIWDGSLSDVTGMECVLMENHKITAHDGELFPGEFNLFFGYLLENGKLVYGPEPLRFMVE